ncbi:unnamed protein product [Sphagnum jensenii]|uniref:Peroxidase n=1 Tax=Sphagnum jensenii TaxID=128206 RepID=A0ABP1BU28_9BRYO
MVATSEVVWVAEGAVAANFPSPGTATAAPTYGLNFYRNSCPGAENIIRAAVIAKWNSDKTITAGLLRMFFHDCFVTGCDASLLILSTPGNQAEIEAGPNLTIHGQDLINTIKTNLEAACPGVVSCADIIALATRDVVLLAGGPQILFPTGRRDGVVSLASAVDVPGPTDTVTQAIAAFNSIGLNVNDLTTLLGAHTVGVAHCLFFSDRLYNFQGTGVADPTMAPALVATLKSVCPQGATGLGNPVALDQGTEFIVDTSYFQQLQLNHGILQIDQELTHDARTSGLVRSFAPQGRAGQFGPSPWGLSFARSMVKLGNVGVLTGTKGQIRKTCGAINT